MQTILGTLQYYEKQLGVAGAQQFRELMSAIRKFLLPGWGFPAAPIRSTNQDVENARYALANLPLEKLYTWKEAADRGFVIAQKSPKQRSVPRSHMNKFVQWCFDKSLLIDPSVVRQAHKTTAPRTKRTRRPALRRTPIAQDRYRLLESEFNPNLAEEMRQYRSYLEDTFYKKRRGKSIRNTTSKMRTDTIRSILGWLHFHCNVPLQDLGFDLIIRPTPINDPDSEVAAEEFHALFQEFAEFLRDRGNQYDSIAHHLASLTRLTQFQHLGKYQQRHGNDIAVMRVIRELIDQYGALAEDELEPVPLERKWLDLPEVIQQITLPLFKETESKTYAKNRRTQRALASSFQMALLWAFMSLMPPRRSREWRTCKLVFACSINAKPDDLRDGEWIWPLPENRWSKEEIQYSYLTRQYIYQDPVTLEQFGGYLGSVPPSDRPLERIAVWFKDTPRRAAKSGDSHGDQAIPVLDRVVYQGKRLYDFLEAYIMGYWRDRYGNWASAGQTLEAPNDTFKFYELRSAIAKDPQSTHLQDQVRVVEQQVGWLCVGRESGNLHRSSDFGNNFARAAYRLTGKSINPHMLRSIYAVHMIESGCGRAVLLSLATAMGHKLKTLENIYDKRRPPQKTRLIEIDLQKRIDHIFAGLKGNDIKLGQPVIDLEYLRAMLRRLPRDQRRLLLAEFQQDME